MSGKVYLVGAGPGDVGLITVKGRQLLEEADVIVYDNLANPRLLQDAKASCIHIYVGKKSGQHTMQQEDINQLLVKLAKDHELIIRLKGGDPYVFGRGSEEGEALYKARIPFEVVPGISSSIGGLTYAGIPITSRDIARSFHVVTGHVSKDGQDVDYVTLAKLKGTLVFLMGVANLENIVKGLLSGGLEDETPVAIIYRASTPYQKVTEGKLSNIISIANIADIQPPSLIVVGEVIKQRSILKFFEDQPLFGKKVIVTRSRATNSKLVKRLLNNGAIVEEVPVIKTVAINDDQLDQGIKRISGNEVIIFTSGVTVNRFMERLAALSLDLRHLGKCKVIAIGSETAKVMKSHGLIVDYVPDQYNLKGLDALLIDQIPCASKLLIPRSAKADHQWIEGLEVDYKVEEILCYDTIFAGIDESLKLKVEGADYITFTSSSTVHGLMHQLKDQSIKLASNTKIVAIGPTTKETLKSYEVEVDLQPDRYTVKDMVDSMIDDLRN